MSDKTLFRLLTKARDELCARNEEMYDPTYGLAEMCLDVAYGLVSNDPSVYAELPDAIEALADELKDWKE